MKYVTYYTRYCAVTVGKQISVSKPGTLVVENTVTIQPLTIKGVRVAI